MDDIVNVANMAKDANVPLEVIRNGIIMSAACLSDLSKQPDSTATFAELRKEYDAQQGAIDDLHVCLNEVRATQNALTTALAMAAASHRGHLRILDPEKYQRDREKLCPFITQLRLKVALYPDHQSQLHYAVSLLEYRTLDQVMPYITNDRINQDNLAGLIGILETAFGNLDKVVTTERKLRNLRQANRDFPTYYAKFVGYAADTTSNEVAKKSQLEEGLCHELKNDLIARDEPKLFVALISLLQKLDQKRRHLTASAPGRKNGPTAQQHTHTYAYALPPPLQLPQPPRHLWAHPQHPAFMPA